MTPPVDTCPNAAEHTNGPSGYVAWQEWAKRMKTTHRQVKCPGCGLFKVWVPR
jgi:hypothetical protein